MNQMDRRDVLKTASAAVAAGMLSSAQAKERPRTARPKKVVIAGGGIGGLCCGYELMMRGHDVVLLEASGRTGGHVKTIHDPLAAFGAFLNVTFTWRAGG